ncbi:MAG: hypothetical protein ACTSUO_03500 [Candidatus Thorarchaeota archaeon]
MRLPVCVFDIESDMLCPNCQERLDKGEITEFDVKFSKWLLEKVKDYPSLDTLALRRAIKTDDLLLLIVKKKNKDILLSLEDLLDEIKEKYGTVLVFEGPVKLRTAVRSILHPVVEVGVNSLYLPNGFKESIVMLRTEDKERVSYSKDQLSAIVSAIVGESVLFQYQDEREEKQEESKPDEFDVKMKDFAGEY